jgi:hypothetical protein
MQEAGIVQVIPLNPIMYFPSTTREFLSIFVMPGSFVFAIHNTLPTIISVTVQDLCRIGKKAILQRKNAQCLLMSCIFLRIQCGMAYGIGRGEIRTHVTIAGESVFETDAFGHSATLP